MEEPGQKSLQHNAELATQQLGIEELVQPVTGMPAGYLTGTKALLLLMAGPTCIHSALSTIMLGAGLQQMYNAHLNCLGLSDTHFQGLSYLCVGIAPVN